MNVKEALKKIKDQTDLFQYDPTKHGVTQSSLNTWMDCEKKARYYFRGLKSVGNGATSMPLTFGSVFHDFQDVVLSDIKSGLLKNSSEVEECIKEISKHVYEKFKWDEKAKESNATGQANIRESFKFMEQLIPRYFNFYKRDFYTFKWKGIEEEFKVNIHKIPVKGKRDGVMDVDDAVNKRLGLFLMEHKTKSRFDTDALQKTLPSMYQVLVYVLTYYLEHEKIIDGVCYNVIRKPALRKKVSETTDQFIARCMVDIDKRPQYYFVRFWHEFDMTDLAIFSETFSNQILKFKQWQAQNENLDVRNTSKCQAMYGTCQYIDYCTSGETDIAGLEIKEKLFSELG